SFFPFRALCRRGIGATQFFPDSFTYHECRENRRGKISPRQSFSDYQIGAAIFSALLIAVGPRWE
ncbi:MAG TPA: hypothetical protein VLS90_20720, partial [Thermodesulfobacteriota bacterium]|nr:hypothetical protein [Thermodesulfobacteriota bacterium]